MAVVDAEDRIGKPGVFAQNLEMIKAAGPAGVFVDFLKGDDVGFQALDQVRDFLQARLEPAARSKTRNGHEATAVGDVEGNDAEARHTLEDISRTIVITYRANAQ